MSKIGYKRILFSVFSLLSLLTINNSNLYKSSMINNNHNAYAKRYIRHHHRHKRFKYNYKTLSYIHKIIFHYYGVRFHHKELKSTAHIVYGHHNPNKYILKYRLKRYIKKHKLYIYHNKPTWKEPYQYKQYYKHQYDLELQKANNQGTQFNNILRDQLIKDINNSRRYYHRKPVTVNLIMQKTADYRNNKTQYAYDHPRMAFKYEPHLTEQQFKAEDNMTDGWAHGIDTHTTGFDYLMHHGYAHKKLWWGANNGTWLISNDVEQPDGSKDKWSDEDPRGIANNMDDQNINYDNYYGNHNAHRINELNPIYHHLGVGVTYNPKNNLGTINEQFSN